MLRRAVSLYRCGFFWNRSKGRLHPVEVRDIPGIWQPSASTGIARAHLRREAQIDKIAFPNHERGMTFFGFTKVNQSSSGRNNSPKDYSRQDLAMHYKSVGGRGNGGAPGAIPTRDLSLRRRALYATELREHMENSTTPVLRCQWSVVSGQWSVVSGQWSVVSRQLSVAIETRNN